MACWKSWIWISYPNSHWISYTSRWDIPMIVAIRNYIHLLVYPMTMNMNPKLDSMCPFGTSEKHIHPLLSLIVSVSRLGNLGIAQIGIQQITKWFCDGNLLLDCLQSPDAWCQIPGSRSLNIVPMLNVRWTYCAVAGAICVLSDHQSSTNQYQSSHRKTMWTNRWHNHHHQFSGVCFQQGPFGKNRGADLLCHLSSLPIEPIANGLSRLSKPLYWSTNRNLGHLWHYL